MVCFNEFDLEIDNLGVFAMNNRDLLFETENLNQIRNHMREGHHSLALSLLVEDYQFHKHNLSILSYLAACYYMTGHYGNFKRYTFELLDLFNANRKHLDDEKNLKITLSLVKLLEELGEIGLCARLLKSCPLKIEAELSANEAQLLAHKLRLFSTYSISNNNDLLELYNFCVSQGALKDSNYIDYECALLLSECQLFGLNHSKARLERFLISNKGNHSHKRFLVFDYLYENLKRNNVDTKASELFEMFVYLEVDSFEKLIWDLYLETNQQKPHQKVSLERIDELSPMNAIRVLHLMSESVIFESESSEILKKMGFFINSLSSTSRSILLNSFPAVAPKTMILLQIKSVLINGKLISTSRSKSIHKLLELLVGRTEESTEKAISELVEEQFNDSSYSKLRVIVARANSFVLKTSGLSKAISINKNQIQVSHNLTISRGA